MTSRKVRLLLLVPAFSLVAGVAALLPAGAAQADINSQIRASQAQLDRLNRQAEAAAERYNAGRIALAAAQQRASLARAAEGRDSAAVAALRVQADELAAKVYRDGSTAGMDMAVLSSPSGPRTLLDRLGMLDQLAQHQQAVLHQLATARHREADSAAQAQLAVHAAQLTVASLQADKASVQSAASQAQQVLGQLEAKQQQLIQQARDAAARAAAQAEAAAVAAEARANAAAMADFASQQITGASAPSGSYRHYSGSAASVAVQVARSELGKPYEWGAAGPNSFDCSGLTEYAYAQAGISLPHYTGDQWNSGRHVSRGELRPGDLVFFEQNIGHVGIYIGSNQFIHAPHSGDVVKVSDLSGWYSDNYQGAVRIAG